MLLHNHPSSAGEPTQDYLIFILHKLGKVRQGKAMLCSKLLCLIMGSVAEPGHLPPKVKPMTSSIPHIHRFKKTLSKNKVMERTLLP